MLKYGGLWQESRVNVDGVKEMEALNVISGVFVSPVFTSLHVSKFQFCLCGREVQILTSVLSAASANTSASKFIRFAAVLCVPFLCLRNQDFGSVYAGSCCSEVVNNYPQRTSVSSQKTPGRRLKPIVVRRSNELMINLLSKE